MMFEKPKKKRQTSQLRRNKDIKPGTRCWFECGRLAVETHELKAGHGYRTLAIDAGFNIPVCRVCHDKWDELPKKVKDVIRSMRQEEVMEMKQWTIEEFVQYVGKNYIGGAK